MSRGHSTPHNVLVPVVATATEGEFYTVPAAARALQVSPSTVWRWIEAEKLRAYRVGPRSIRIRKDDLAAVVQPARAQTKEVKTMTPRLERVLEPPTQDELARRQRVVTEILALRAKSGITPTTTADLIHQVREQERQSYGR